MANTTLKISLPEGLKKEAAAVAKEGHYTMSGYVQDLMRTSIRKERERRLLHEKLREADQSGYTEMSLDEMREYLLKDLTSK